MPSILNPNRPDFLNTFKHGTEYTCAQISIGDNTEGLGVQQITVTVQKTIKQLYEIGSKNTYYIGGRPTGTGRAVNIIGPAEAALNMAEKLGDVCDPQHLTISANQKECQMYPNVQVICKSCAINSCEISADAQTDMVTGTWGFIFADMEYTSGGGTGEMSDEEAVAYYTEMEKKTSEETAEKK